MRLVLALPALPQPGGPGESACQPRPGVGQPADGLVQVVGVVDLDVDVTVGVVGVVGVDLAGHHLGHHRRLGLLDERLVHGPLVGDVLVGDLLVRRHLVRELGHHLDDPAAAGRELGQRGRQVVAGTP